MANQAAPVSMLKLVTGMQNNRENTRGFTLIEILVVVLIVGITLGFALLSFGDFGSRRRIVISAEQFVNYVKFVQQQAIMETSTLGILLNKNDYQVLRFQPPSSWQAMPQKSVFHQQHFPANAIVNLENRIKRAGWPQIIINSSGDMTAFKLLLGSTQEANIAKVVALSNGAISVQSLPSS